METTPPAPGGISIDPWLRPFLAQLKPLFREAMAVSLFINLLAIAVPVFVLQVYDRVVFHSGISTLQGLVIGILLVIGFDFTLRQTRARMLQSAALQIDVAVSRKVVGKLLALPLRALESRPASFWQLLFRDADVVRNTVSGATAVLAMDLIFASIFLAIVAVIAWPVFWVLIVIFALFVALAWRAGRAVAEASDSEKAKHVSRDLLVSELILGRSTIKALSLGNRMRGMWENRQADAIAESLTRGVANDGYGNAGQSLTLIATVAMTGIGAIAIMGQDLTIGGLIAANMLSSRLLAPMNQLVGAWRTYGAFKQSSERLGKLFEEAEEPVQSDIQMERPKGRITLENATFRYAPDSAPAIDKVKIEFNGGMTAVMGANGCGKTTLAKLITGLYRPAEGRALIDGADMAQFSRGDLSRWIGFVPQDCVLFNGTVRDNIAYARPEASDAEIIRAATLACAHGPIIDMAKGYGTPVGEGGAQLSGGLRQRIAIARALLGDPPVLVMDEPTSNLDRQAEEELRNNLAALSSGRTIVLITHSSAMLQACQNVVIMERGHIKEAGPTQKILQAVAAARAARTEANAPVPIVRAAVGGDTPPRPV